MRVSAFLLLLATVSLENVQECYGQRTTPHSTSGPQRTTPRQKQPQQQQQPGARPGPTAAHSTQKPLQAKSGQSGKLVAATTLSPQRTTPRAVTTTARRGTTAKGAQLSKTTTSPHSQKLQNGITTKRTTTPKVNQPTRLHFEDPQQRMRLPASLLNSFSFFMLPENYTFEHEPTTTNVTFSDVESKNGTTVTMEPETSTTVTKDSGNDTTVAIEPETSTTATRDSDNSTTVAMETESDTFVTMATVESNSTAEDSTETTPKKEIMLFGVTDGENTTTTPGVEGSTRKKLKRRKVTTTTTTQAPTKRVLKRRKIKVDHEKLNNEKVE